MENEIAKNIAELRRQIAKACEKYNRSVDDIGIVAVTKTHPASVIKAAIAAGINNIGENKVQEAEKKFAELESSMARLHMIGHLQTNKAKKAVQLFDVIQSVDSFKLAQEISRHAISLNKQIECLIEVNTSGEVQKHGVAPDGALALVSQVMTLPNIRLTGLMTVGPLTEEEAAIRKSFHLCYELFVRAKEIAGSSFVTLSMGMSGDFQLAIAEGATLLRIGSAIFGNRKGKPDSEFEADSVDSE